MPESVRLESPLVRYRPDAHCGGGSVRVAERQLLAHLNLRGDPADPTFLAGAAGVLGTALPLVPNTVVMHDVMAIYWLGPDEWLVVAPGAREAGLAGALRAAVGARDWSAVTELSGGQTVLQLVGTAVRELLAKGCPLDLHPRIFAPGQCAQTLLAKAPVLLRPLDAGMELIVRRSFADYLWRWLEDAALEYGGLGAER